MIGWLLIGGINDDQPELFIETNSPDAISTEWRLYFKYNLTTRHFDTVKHNNATITFSPYFWRNSEMFDKSAACEFPGNEEANRKLVIF